MKSTIFDVVERIEKNHVVIAIGDAKRDFTRTEILTHKFIFNKIHPNFFKNEYASDPVFFQCDDSVYMRKLMDRFLV